MATFDFVDGRFWYGTDLWQASADELMVTDAARAALSVPAPASPLTDEEVEVALLERELEQARVDGVITCYRVAAVPTPDSNCWRVYIYGGGSHPTHCGRGDSKLIAVTQIADHVRTIRTLRAERAAQQEQEAVAAAEAQLNRLQDAGVLEWETMLGTDGYCVGSIPWCRVGQSRLANAQDAVRHGQRLEREAIAAAEARLLELSGAGLCTLVSKAYETGANGGPVRWRMDIHTTERAQEHPTAAPCYGATKLECLTRGIEWAEGLVPRVRCINGMNETEMVVELLQLGWEPVFIWGNKVPAWEKSGCKVYRRSVEAQSDFARRTLREARKQAAQ